MLGGCHGADEVSVFNELCLIVDEVIELYRRDGESSFPEQQPVTIWRTSFKMSPNSNGGRAGGSVASLLDQPCVVSTAGEL